MFCSGFEVCMDLMRLFLSSMVVFTLHLWMDGLHKTSQKGSKEELPRLEAWGIHQRSLGVSSRVIPIIIHEQGNEHHTLAKHIFLSSISGGCYASGAAPTVFIIFLLLSVLRLVVV